MTERRTFGFDPLGFFRGRQPRERVVEVPEPRFEKPVTLSHEDEARLTDNIEKINSWAKEKGLNVTFVSGLVLQRDAHEYEGGQEPNHKMWVNEILLVRGKDKNGKQKPFWQFPGGRVKPDDRSHVAALQREIYEELGINIAEKLGRDPRSKHVTTEDGQSPLTYGQTYVPLTNGMIPEQGSTVLAIHDFHMKIKDDKTTSEYWGFMHPWTKKGFALGSDVDEVEWTGDPLIEYGKWPNPPRLLTPQTDYILRKLGFKGPENANTPDPNYNGDPTTV